MLNPNLSKQIEVIKKLTRFNKYIGFVYNQTSVGNIDEKPKYLDKIYFSVKDAINV